MQSGQSAKALKAAHRGVTLLEMALSMMILAILSVGVSSLVKTGVENQLAQRTHQNMQTVGLNIVDDLRMDIRTADRATVSNGGNTLTLSTPNGNIIYNLTASNDFTRFVQATGVTRTYNDPNAFNPRLQVRCPNGCFQAALLNNDPVPSPRQIFVEELLVEQVLPNGSGTMIDRAFGAANFPVRAFSFDVMSAKEFQ